MSQIDRDDWFPDYDWHSQLDDIDYKSVLVFYLTLTMNPLSWIFFGYLAYFGFGATSLGAFTIITLFCSFGWPLVLIGFCAVWIITIVLISLILMPVLYVVIKCERVYLKFKEFYSSVDAIMSLDKDD